MNNDYSNKQEDEDIYDKEGNVVRCFCGSTRFNVFCESSANSEVRADGVLVHGEFQQQYYSEYAECQECRNEFKLHNFKDFISFDEATQLTGVYAVVEPF